MPKADWPLPEGVPVVEVEWWDSAAVHGWQAKADALASAGKKALPCKSVGYLWKRNKHRLLLVQSQSASGQAAGTFSIPMTAVAHLRVLTAAVGTAPPEEPPRCEAESQAPTLHPASLALE